VQCPHIHGSAEWYLKISSTISIEQKYRNTWYCGDTYHLVSTKFKTPSVWKAYTADIIYTESAERQLPTEQMRTNYETLLSR